MKKLLFTLGYIISLSIFSQNPPIPGLVAHFELNGNGLDISPYHINGTLYNTGVTNGRNGTPNAAISFNGINSKIISGTSNRSVYDTVTVSAWIRTTATNNHAFFVGKYDWTIDRGYQLKILNGRVYLSGRNNSGYWIRTNYSSTLVNDGNWHHVMGVVAGNRWEIWVDCNFDNGVNSSASTPYLTNNEPLTIGYYNMGDQGNHFYLDGEVDEVRIYNRLLTNSEIISLCRQVSVIQENPDEGFYIFPNPAKNYIKIDNPLNKPISDIKIFDISGRLILNFNNNFERLNVSNLEKGTYIIQILDEYNKTIFNKKIIIIK